MAGAPVDEERKVDFFLSYAALDAAWAEWTAYVLEDAGYTTLLQAWDFRPGSNFVLRMQDALGRCDRVIPLLSEAYLRSAFAASEWAAALTTDPRGREERLLPVRVEKCEPVGLLRTVVYVDLVGLDETEAKRRLLAGVAKGRAKPVHAPGFPGTRTGARPPPGFPGRVRVPDPRRRFLVWAGSAAIVLLVVGAAIWMPRRSPRTVSTDLPRCAEPTNGDWQALEAMAGEQRSLTVEGADFVLSVVSAAYRPLPQGDWEVVVQTRASNSSTKEARHGHWFYDGGVVENFYHEGKTCFGVVKGDPVISKGLANEALVGFRSAQEPKGTVALRISGDIGQEELPVVP